MKEFRKVFIKADKKYGLTLSRKESPNSDSCLFLLFTSIFGVSYYHNLIPVKIILMHDL